MSYIQDLAAEITADPLAIGYAGMTDQQVADSLNGSTRPKNRESMSGKEIGAAINSAEYAALTAAEKDRVIALANLESIDPFGFAQTIMLDIFAGGSNTIQTLAAARVTTQSRAEEIGLAVREVKAEHVTTARSL